MLDLKDLERRLDEALEKETNESLTEWLLSKRQSNIEDFLGAGEIVILEEMACYISARWSSHVQLNDENIFAGENTLAMAA